jgi:hypothetical protein
MPGFIKPQLGTLKSKAPKGDQWLHEIKYDGYRVQVHLNRGRKKVFTRNGLDWTKRFTEIAGALAIPGEAIIDGEVVVIHEGRTNFSELQAELALADRAGWSITPSIFYGVTAISAGSLRSSASRRCWISSAKTTSSCRCSIRNTSPVTGRRCSRTPPN